MKLVIDIPDEYYELYKDTNHNVSMNDFAGLYLLEIIRNSKPLPKGHGRLIDADELYGDFIDGTEGYDCQTWNRIEIGDIIENAPTIIEADKEDNDE